METGQSNPDLSLLPELADFFECSVDVLLDYELRSHSRTEAVKRIRQARIDKDSAFPSPGAFCGAHRSC